MMHIANGESREFAPIVEIKSNEDYLPATTHTARIAKTLAYIKQ
jgi:hypothetical protein